MTACEALVTLAGESRKAMADQLATVSKGRLLERIGMLRRGGMEAVDRAIHVHLGLKHVPTQRTEEPDQRV